MSAQVALKLFLFPEHIERAQIVECAKGVELFHHETLDGELSDNGFGDAVLGYHAVDVEMDAQPVCILQVADVSVCRNGQPLVVGIDLDVAEGHGVGVAAEPYAEVQGQGEGFEYRCKGARDVLEVCAPGDGRRAIGQWAIFFFAGQHDVTLVETQLGIDLTDDKVAEGDAWCRSRGRKLLPRLAGTPCIREGGVQVANVDAHNGIPCREFSKPSVNGIAFHIVNVGLEVGIGIDVLEVEESPFWLTGILARMLVVVVEVQVADVDEPVAPVVA